MHSHKVLKTLHFLKNCLVSSATAQQIGMGYLSCHADCADLSCHADGADLSCHADGADLSCHADGADLSCHADGADLSCHANGADLSCHADGADSTLPTTVFLNLSLHLCLFCLNISSL